MASLDTNFVKASSDNLPIVHIFMVHTFLKCDDRFNAAEIRGVKACNAQREHYGDNAIGFVEIKREVEICPVRCKVCPEHKIRNKGYTVEVIIDEAKEEIRNIQCYDCAAASGGCKHALAFLMWLHRRSEKPSPTEVTCYWKKARLSTIPSAKKYVEVNEFLPKNKKLPELCDNTAVFKRIMDAAIHQNIKSHVTRYYVSSSASPSTSKKENLKILSLHYLMSLFKDAGGDSVDQFLKFSTKEISEDACLLAQSTTIDQNNSPMWHELRYGRITASKFYEAAKCKTAEGSLVETIIGVRKIKTTKAMEREIKLEAAVINAVQEKLHIRVDKTGLIINPLYPIFGASPDGICNDFVVEIKCPISEITYLNYIKDGKITNKYKAQVHLQMFLARKKKALFCVAKPNFENSKEFEEVYVDFDEDFFESVKNYAEMFWKKCIFKKLFTAG